MSTRHVVRTESGSVYLIERDAEGEWWVTARNVANPASQELGSRRYPIAAPTPWPPIVGYPIVLAASPELPEGDPALLPGGGKWTSRVVSVELDEAPGLA
jgi:hypothetical protein